MAKLRFLCPPHAQWYVPIDTDWGTIQSHFIRITAKDAWKDFCRKTGKSKEELIEDGYKVVQIEIRLTRKWELKPYKEVKAALKKIFTGN